MSLRVEWVTADCAVTVLTAADAEERLRPDELVDADLVLLLGGASGGAFAIEGSAEDLRAFAERVRAQITAATRR